MGVFEDWAEAIWKQGFNVLPIKPGAKSPKGGPQWAEWSKRRQREDEVKKLVKDYPDWNIGLICFNIVYMDLDFKCDHPFKEKVINKIISTLPYSPLERRSFVTPHGFARIYKKDPRIKTGTNIKYDKAEKDKTVLDMIVNGQLVSSPSIHPETNNPYVWVFEDILNVLAEELPVLTLEKFNEIKALEPWINEEQKEQSDFVDMFNGPNTNERDPYLFRFCLNLSQDDLVSKMDEEEAINYIVDKTFKFDQAANFAKGSYFKSINPFNPLKACREKVIKWIEWLKSNEEKNGKSWKPGQKSTAHKYPTKDEGFYFSIETEKRIIHKPDYKGFCRYAIDELKFVTDDSSCVFDYNDGFYSINSQTKIEHEISKLTQKHIQPMHINNFVKQLKADSYKPEKYFKNKENLINVKNGILNIKTKELIPHSPDYFFRYKLPHDYDRKATCPRFIEFLDYIFQNNKELHCVIAQVVGYLICGGTPFLHKGIGFYGGGRNGKSTLLQIISSLIGNDNFSTVSLSKLHLPFSAVHLDGKLANIVEETPNDKINSEIFKTATSGGYLMGAFKNKDEYKFLCNAKFVFACNELPHFGDNSYGLLERLYLIPFDFEIPEADRDHKIIDKLMPELPGILNWALAGLEILLDNGKLPKLDSIKSTFDEYQYERDSVHAWCEDYIESDQNSIFVSSTSIYKQYRKMTEEMGKRAVSDVTFYKRFSNYVKRKFNFDSKTKDSSGRIKGYKGIRTRDQLGASQH